MENENPTPTPEKKGGKLKILIVLLVVVVVAGGAVLLAGGDFFQGLMKSKEKTVEVDTIKEKEITAVSLQKDIASIESYVSSDPGKAIDNLEVLKKVLEEKSDKKAYFKVAELESLVKKLQENPGLIVAVEKKFEDFKIEEDDLTKKVISNDIKFISENDFEEFTTKYSQIIEEDAGKLLFAVEIESTQKMKDFSFFLSTYTESPFSVGDVKVMTGLNGTYQETSFTVDANGVVEVSDINGVPAFIIFVGRDNFVDTNKVFGDVIFIDSFAEDEQMFFNIKKSY